MARRTLVVGIQICRDRERRLTDATEDGWLVESVARPRLRFVVRDDFVAQVAGIKHFTAPESERDYVPVAIVVCTPSCRIHVDAADFVIADSTMHARFSVRNSL